MEDLINRMIYHPLVVTPTMHLTDLMCNVSFSLAAGAIALACTLSLRTIGVLRRMTYKFESGSGHPTAR
jgi:hypothetical protein